MKMTISANRFLSNCKQGIFRFLLAFTLVFSSLTATAKVEMNGLFVSLSDAMEAVKQQQNANALPHLTQFKADFEQTENHDSEAGKQVAISLTKALNNPNSENLEQLSKTLYRFEKEQNPVDYSQQRKLFAKRVQPVYDSLNQAIQSQDLEAVKTEYKRFDITWTRNEKVVRETSLGHYGQIETAMTLLRVAMLAEPANFAEMQAQSTALNAALQDFKAGNVLQPKVVENAPQDLPSGIRLLEKALNALKNQQADEAKQDITLFIQQWAIFEGDVRTRNGELYTKVESQLPIIMVKGSDSENIAQFQQLIDELNQIDVASSYGMLDAMLILLREGTEAILIIMALLTSLNAANQPRAKRWVYAGAGLGLGFSLLGAVALQQLFPTATAGTSREIIEGGVGVVAVVMMLFVGAWLHSKSSVQGWKKFVDKQVAQALATGSLLSMLSLAFLSVFREGAETILFYAGMLPLIDLKDLLSGIGLAIVLLAIIAFVMNYSSKRLPIHKMFSLMTWLIYALGFKILGVSVHALQLTKVVPTHILEQLPNLPSIGFYATWEGILAQVGYLVLIPVVGRLFR